MLSIALATDIIVKDGPCSKRATPRVYHVSSVPPGSNTVLYRYDLHVVGVYDMNTNAVICRIRGSGDGADLPKMTTAIRGSIAGGSDAFADSFGRTYWTRDNDAYMTEAIVFPISQRDVLAICEETKTDRLYVRLEILFSSLLAHYPYYVELSTVDIPSSVLKACVEPSLAKPKRQLTPSLPNLLLSFEGEHFAKDTLTNFVVQCGDREFHVHRGVLAGRSHVLKEMLVADMAEKKEGRLVLDAFEPPVVEKFLTKIYNPGVAVSSDTMDELKVLAQLFHMYEIHDAVSVCGDLLSAMLNEDPENLFPVLQISHLCGIDEVFKQAVAQLRGMEGDVWDRPELKAIGPDVMFAALKAMALMK